MFGAVEPVWRMVVRYVSVLAAVFAATRGHFHVAAGLVTLFLVLTALASMTSSERLQSGWLSTVFTQRSRKSRPRKLRGDTSVARRMSTT